MSRGGSKVGRWVGGGDGRLEQANRKVAAREAGAQAGFAEGLASGLTGPMRHVVAHARSRIFELWILAVSLAYGASILVLFHHIRTSRLVRRILRSWTTIFIWSARALLGVRWRLEGYEDRPGGPAIYICNHQSYWESIALCTFLPDVNVVSKRGAMRIPVFGWGLRWAPMIPVDRDSPGQNIRRLLREARASLAEGRSILIFPEGTRVPVGGRQPFQRGFEILATRAGVPVVPIVQNAGLLWPKGFGAKRPGTVTLRFLPRLDPGRDAAAFAARMERMLNEEKDRLAARRA